MEFKEKYIKKQRDLSGISPKPPFPRIIKIDICNVCNYACIFCPQAKQINKQGNINDELCMKIISDAYLAGARELCLSSTGEPLLNSNLEKYIKYAKQLGYEYVFFNTNGFLLDEARASALLENGIDSIKISINAGSRESYELVHGVDGYERVLRNLDGLLDARKRTGSKCKIYVSYVAIKQTLEEAAAIEKQLSDKLDGFIVMKANLRAGSISELLDGLYAGEDEFSYKYPCSQLFNNLYVSAEGYVNVCCQDFENRTVVADLNDKQMGVEQAWHSDKFVAFRSNYLKGNIKGTICYNCIHNTDEEFESIDGGKAFYEESTAKTENLLCRARALIEMGGGNIEHSCNNAD